jgi:hypothetical protein
VFCWICVNVQAYWCASSLFNNSFSSSGYTALINNELWNMKKEAVVILSGLLSYNLPGGLEENHSIPPSDLLISKPKFSSRTSWVKIKSSDFCIGIFGHMAVLATTTTTIWHLHTLCTSFDQCSLSLSYWSISRFSSEDVFWLLFLSILDCEMM